MKIVAIIAVSVVTVLFVVAWTTIGAPIAYAYYWARWDEYGKQDIRRAYGELWKVISAPS